MDDLTREAGVLPTGATRRLLPEYGHAVVGLRLDSGSAWISGLQDRLAALARRLEQRVRRSAGQPLPPLLFGFGDAVDRPVGARWEYKRGQVRQIQDGEEWQH